MIIKSYAKINLEFEILDKLPNGYHNIHSVFQAVDIYDLITIKKLNKGFELTGAIVSSTKENLIDKAKGKLESYVNKELPCSIHLIKSLPIGAGLGGGSSNAASTLIGLNKLFSLNLDKNELVKLGTDLGADVPFFIANSGTAEVRGIGEKIKPIERVLSGYYVLARPHKRINTAEMYKKYDETNKSFFELASKSCPDVKKMYDYFSSISNEVGMSGSGPTIFAGFNNYNKALESIQSFGVMKFNGDFSICRPVDETYKIL